MVTMKFTKNPTIEKIQHNLLKYELKQVAPLAMCSDPEAYGDVGLFKINSFMKLQLEEAFCKQQIFNCISNIIQKYTYK